MKILRSRIALRFALTSCLLMVYGTIATASPYYSVTDLGRTVPFGHGQGVDSGYVVDSQGNSYPFPRSLLAPESMNNIKGLPEGDIKQGSAFPVDMPYQMNPLLANSQGIVVGTIPAGINYSNPWYVSVFGFVQKLPDGSYSEFHSLDFPNIGGPPLDASGPPSLDLNARNEVLEDSHLISLGNPTNLSKLHSVRISDLVSPEMNDKYPSIYGYKIDDNGDILATSDNDDRYLLLTPPGQPVPSPVPEPSTLVGWGLAGGALWLGSMYRRRRA